MEIQIDSHTLERAEERVLMKKKSKMLLIQDFLFQLNMEE